MQGSLIFVGSAVRERVRFALDPTKTETANKDLDCFEPFLLYSLYIFKNSYDMKGKALSFKNASSSIFLSLFKPPFSKTDCNNSGLTLFGMIFSY